MYLYAFDNPDIMDNDGRMCYAGASDIAYAESTDGAAKNVSKEFMTWFKFGFILNVCSLSVGVLQIVHFISELEAIGACWMCISAPIGCGGLAWLITGMVYRWRHFGKVCSGDYYDS